jgi:3-oxoacyl-[acyl-carrier protein] reductase
MTETEHDRSDEFCRLDGVGAVVTGSSSGMGRAIALELSRAGARVVVHCRESVDSAEELVELIRGSGGEAQMLVADLSDPAEVDAMLDRSWQLLGGVDAWVNNAGVDLLTGSEAGWSFDEKLAALWEVDIRATIRLARAAGRRMREAGGGSVLNIGWDQAERGMEGDSGELFAAAKGAVMSFTRSLALSLAPTVRVNCIAAGWIRTGWGDTAGEDWQQRVLRETPLGRWGEPIDVAHLARFLLSDESSYLTGQVIYANGGAER